MATNPSNDAPYVRLASISEVETLSELAARAFIHDPVINYINNIDHVKFYRFVIKAAFCVSGRITVVFQPTEQKIVACAIWLPPKKRLSIWMARTMIRSGVLPVLKQWGLTGLLRTVRDYQGTTEEMYKKYFKRENIKGPIDDSWYLQLALTDPEYQGRGYLSLLVREAYKHAPDSSFVLEATTAKSRDIYLHLGFENLTAIKFGAGKTDGLGLAKRKEDATGLEIWAMAKWPGPDGR